MGLFARIECLVPIPMALRSKGQVCDRVIFGMAGENFSGGMDVHLLGLGLLCVVQVAAYATS